ncbi:SDR family NAD(P)-dependent oxidoreductase [Kineococcus sp. T13]|uniref:SDR family NAD(P)-dependent oxidoreductase n=1 Tax=Kineococcus vitellinus TaxID=2696565 RepID=UPI001411D313|nr:SDR family NAD(P)-dependent oxidoreductase [Kineococcus vitellinus]
MQPRGTAVVVGAGSAIGTATARALHALGWSPELWGREPERLRGLVPGAPVHRVDVREREQVAAALAACRRPLTLLVHTAGVFDWCDAESADLDVWDELVDVDLGGAMRTTRLALPLLLADAPSSLVLLGSGAAHRAHPHNAAYVAAKHGLAGFAESVRQEVGARGVGVSLVNPGMVAAGASLVTERAATRPGSLLQPQDVAAAVAHAASAPPHACVSRIDLDPREPV